MPSEKDSIKTKSLKNIWSLIKLRGTLLIILGVILLVFPMATLTVMILMMGVWWLIDGITTIIKSINERRDNTAWRWGLFTGALGVVAGILVLSRPALSTIVTASFLVWFIGLSALIYGTAGIIAGMRLRKQVKGEWSMILGGIFSVFFGIVLIASPFISAMVIVKSMGVIAIIGGATVLIVASSVKQAVDKEN